MDRLQIPAPYSPAASPSSTPIDVSDILDDYFDDGGDKGHNGKEKGGKIENLSLEPSRPPMPPRPATTPPVMTGASVGLGLTTTTPGMGVELKPMWKTALDETIHFAGGLISHPFESTKHYSVLRHSSGLVYYRGASTSIAVTTFSDTQLPLDRSLWLQRKGFSGNLGMNTSAFLGTSSGWIDVTPSAEVLPSDVPENDERAWQRDMKKFTKKTATHKRLSRHVARETCVVRIPAIAQDGYLRLVLCSGPDDKKKVLCSSPVFRVASTSGDMSVLRGASFSTIPLEVGLKTASVVTNTVVNKYLGPARAVATTGVNKLKDKVRLDSVAGKIDNATIAKLGVTKRLEALEQNFDSRKDVSYAPLHQVDGYEPVATEIVGSDMGPVSPFPIRMGGKVVRGTGLGEVLNGIPTANLEGVSGDLLLRLNGIYIGWARVQPNQGAAPDGICQDWHEAIITVGPNPYTPPHVVQKNLASVHMVHDFKSGTFFDATLKAVVMAFLRPSITPLAKDGRYGQNGDRNDGLAAAAMSDIRVAVCSLNREGWAPEETVHRLKMARSTRTLTERYVEVRTHVQRTVDSVPLHLVGVRSTGAEFRDQAFGNGGVFIRR